MIFMDMIDTPIYPPLEISHFVQLAMGPYFHNGRGGDVNFAQSGEQGDPSANCPGFRWGATYRLVAYRTPQTLLGDFMGQRARSEETSSHFLTMNH